MVNKNAVVQCVEAISDMMRETSRWLYENPELGYQETAAVNRLSGILKQAGFSVEGGVADMATAFIATYTGSADKPHIGYFAEYDALPGIGHGCGHNIIAAASVGAAIALTEAWPNMPARITVFGSPAEEGGAVDNAGGKIHLINAGYLEDVDVAMMVHPTSNENTGYPAMLTREAVEMRFTGRTAQPAGTAHEGINALEAAVLAYVGINSLRQYIPPKVWVHGVITEGGAAPNIIPDLAVMRFYVRGVDPGDVTHVAERVRGAARAAATAVGAQVAFREYSNKYLSMSTNEVLADTFERNLRYLGASVGPRPTSPRASTDMGNVSWVVPSIHPNIKIGDPECIGNTHSPEFAGASVAEGGEFALILGAKALALTGFEVVSTPGLLELIKQSFTPLGCT